MNYRVSRKTHYIGVFIIIFLCTAVSAWVTFPVDSAQKEGLIFVTNSTNATDSIRRISLTTNDIVYNPTDQTLYASLPGRVGNIGNSLTQINPRTGEIGSSTYIGSEPTKLALAADKQTIYAYLAGAYTIRKFDTAAQSPGQQFSIIEQNPYDLVTSPKNPNFLAVARGTNLRIGIFINGVEQPQAFPHLVRDFENLAFSASDSILYGTSPHRGLTSLTINETGSVISSETSNLATSAKIKFDNGLIFTSGGEVINADTKTLLGTFPGAGNYTFSQHFVPDTAVGRAYYVVRDNDSGNLKINAYDINTFALIGSLIIPNSPEGAQSFVRWGANGLALGTWEGPVYLIQTSLIPSSEPIPTPSATPTVTPTPTPYAIYTRQISLPTNDLIYNPANQKLYTSVPSRAGENVGNTVTIIDPEKGSIDNSIFVGSEPNKIALADDSVTMYVGLDGAGSIRKLDLNTQKAELQFSLGSNGSGRTPSDIAVKPGAPETVAVLHGEIAIYENGVHKVETPFIQYLSSIVFASANKLISDNSYGGLIEFSVTSEGISEVGELPGAADELYFENGLIYMPSGTVVDSETRLIKGTFSKIGPVYSEAMAIDTANNRAFFLTNNGSHDSYELRAYELDTFRFVGSVNVPGVHYGSFKPVMVRWGENGLAYRDRNDSVFLIQTSLVNSTGVVPTPTPAVTPTPTPSPAYIPSFVRKVDLPIKDIVYNESTDSIYASVPSTAGAERGNSITQISPRTGEIGSSIPVGNEPNKLALADDGRTLYTKLDGDQSIRRLDVVSKTLGLQFKPTGSIQYFFDMAVLPGKPESVAVLDQSEGVTIYDDGVKRAKTGKHGDYADIEGIQIASSSMIYGIRDSSTYHLVKFAVDSSGLTEVSSNPGLFPRSTHDVKLAGGLLYSDTGQVVEPETPKLIGKFPDGGIAMAIDPDLGRVFYMTGSVLTAYDAKTFLKIGSVKLPNFDGAARSKTLLRWGENGLAVLVGNTFSQPFITELYLIQSELVSPTAHVPTGLQLNVVNNISENNSNVTVTVTRTGDISSVTTVDYTTSDETAIAGSDYTFTAGTLTFAAGETSKTINIPLINDNVFEGSERFNFTLSNPSGEGEVYLLNPSAATITISDNESQPFFLTQNLAFYEPPMGETYTAQFTIRLSHPTTKTATVNYVTSDGTATAGIDYVAASGTLTFDPLETTKTIAIQILGDDNHNEPNETFRINFSNAANVSGNPQIIGVIINYKPRSQPYNKFDFDGDGKTDYAIFRPTAGEWWYLRSGDGGNRAFQFGLSTDKIVPADYTGDGKTDVAFFRPSTNEWFVLRSEDSSFYSAPFGATGDIPAPADYDGDGKADIAVFRPSEANWYINKSSGGFSILQFGAAGDIPIPSDFDGDSKADLAVYRPSAGEWWILRSSDAGNRAFQFGNSQDKPIPADYTGDGKTDVAFYRPSTSEWFILRSEDGSFYSAPFGASEDVPVPGDYDGDGKADIAVWRESDRNWYVAKSSGGFSIAAFGAAGDKPIPNAFIP